MTQSMLQVLKNSPLTWQLRRSKLWKRLKQNSAKPAEISFYERVIDKSDSGCIIDVGANNGGKTEIFLSLASRVVAIEPDPASAQTLRNRFRWKPVVVREFAIASEPGTIPFYRFGRGSALNTASPDWAAALTNGTNHMGLSLEKPTVTEVKAETLATIVAEFGPCKYLKVDAEGFEDKVLATLATPIRLVSVEINLPQMWEALLFCVGRLAALNPSYRFNVAITEPPLKLELSEWSTGEQIISAIKTNGWRYVELYAKFD